MFEFAIRWLVCLVLLAVVVQSERTIKNVADNLFEISGEIFMKASVELSTSELSGGINLKNGDFLQIDEYFPVKMVNAHLQLEG